jgi:hypothetical protein
MKNLESFLTAYETDIATWMDDFGEGFLFLGDREKLVPFEDDARVQKLDVEALGVIKRDKSNGSDKTFLQKLETLIHNSSYNEKVA